MEIGKKYYIKRLRVDGVMQPAETCELIKVVDDETVLVKNEDGETRLFRKDMLSEEPTEEIYFDLKSKRGE